METMDELKAEAEQCLRDRLKDPPLVEIVDIGERGTLLCIEHNCVLLRDDKWYYGVTSHPLLVEGEPMLIGMTYTPSAIDALYQTMRMVFLHQVDKEMIMGKADSDDERTS